MRLRGRPPQPGAAPLETPPSWEFVPEGWHREVRGWDVDTIAAVYRGRWPEFLECVAGAGFLGVSHEVPLGRPLARDDYGWHNVIVSFGYVLARASHPKPRLSLLDWGGGPGHYAVLARALMPELELEYHSRDLRRLVALGRELLPDVFFHDDDRCLERTYELVFASNSLQYARDYGGLLTRLAHATEPGGFLYVALLPITREAASYVVVQRPDEHGYETEYLGWIVNRDEMLEHACAAGLELERELMAPGEIHASGAPEPADHRSFLFRRTAS